MLVVMDSGSPGPSELSSGEIRLLQLVAQGHSAIKVARSLALSEATLRRRLRAVQTKLDANSRINAVYIAAKRGLI